MLILWVFTPFSPGDYPAFRTLQFVGRPAGGTYASSYSPGNGQWTNCLLCARQQNESEISQAVAAFFLPQGGYARWAPNLDSSRQAGRTCPGCERQNLLGELLCLPQVFMKVPGGFVWHNCPALWTEK